MKLKGYELVKDLEFERLAGTSDEHKAADIIADYIENLGLEPVFEEFEVNRPVVKKAEFKVLKPYEKSYDVNMVMMSDNTDANGITKEFLYIENAEAVNLTDASDKIVMLNGVVSFDIYKKLVAANVAGFITLSGTLYDDLENTDLEERQLRKRHYDNGKIPGVSIRIIDAQEIVLKKASLVKLTTLEKQEKTISKNVIATIEGENPNEEIVFTAHYDSVRFAKGSYDNATGSAKILGLLEYFSKNKPKRTLRFIWCGAEEMGLLGSLDYVEKNNLDNVRFCLNVDMTSVILGYDACICTSEMALVNYIDYFAKAKGHALKVSQAVYSSDSTAFASKGIPAITFARLAPRGGAVIHSRQDDMKHLSYDAYEKTFDFILDFTIDLVYSHTFYVDKKIPDDIVKKLDDYLGRKKDKK